MRFAAWGTSSHRTKTASRQTPPGRQPQNRMVQASSGATQRADIEHGTAGVAMRMAFSLSKSSRPPRMPSSTVELFSKVVF
jgi:hypothetical protein